MASTKAVWQGGVLVISIQERRLLDEVTIGHVREELIAAVAVNPQSKILLHFGLVDFVSTSFFGVLIRLHKKCWQSKSALKLCNLAPNIREVLRIIGLEKVFSVYPEAEDAIRAFTDDDQPGEGGVYARLKPRPPGGSAGAIKDDEGE